MESQKKIIEVFTSGCPLCEPVVKLVKETACSNCEVIVYNLNELCDTLVFLYSVPAAYFKCLYKLVRKIARTRLLCNQVTDIVLDLLKIHRYSRVVNNPNLRN